MQQYYLELAPAKTELTIISSLKHPPNHITINVGGIAIPYSRHIKHLDVLVHDHLSWLPHVTAVTQQADQIAKASAELRNPRFADVRERLIHGVNPDTLLSYMLQSQQNWSNVCEAAQ